MFKQLLDPVILLTRYPDRNEKSTGIQVKGIRTNMANLITVEDIGIGQPEMPVSLLTEWEQIKIVELLCRARKARFF